jgi:hypothetical protein
MYADGRAVSAYIALSAVCMLFALGSTQAADPKKVIR